MTEDQKLLSDTLNRLLADHIEAAGLDPDEAALGSTIRKELEDGGFTALLVPEAGGGAGASWADAGIVFSLIGYHSAPGALGESILENVPAAGGLASLLASAPRSIVGEPAFPRSALGNDENALLAVAAMRSMQMAGACERVLELAADYAKERVQFGRPLAAFQAVQQQLAILAGEVAAARRAADHAFIAMDKVSPDLGAAAFEVATAKVRSGEAAGKVAAIAHQVHGAMGFTYEHRLHRFTRRLWTWRGEAGSETYWAQRLGQQALADGADALWTNITARG